MQKILNSVITICLCATLLCCSQGLYAQQAKKSEAFKPMKHNMANMKKMTGMKGMAGMKGMVHDHKPISLPDNAAIPKINLEIYRDEKDGFNLHLHLAEFEIEPPELEGGNSTSKAKKMIVDGHAHLYVNSIKIRRLYGNFDHLPQSLFKPGINMVMVSLNAHNHDVWTIGKKQIMATLMLKPDQESFILHDFSSSPLTTSK